MLKSQVGNSVLFYFREGFISVQDLDGFEIAVQRVLLLVFVSSTNHCYSSSQEFFLTKKIYWKELEIYQNISFWWSWKASSCLNSFLHYTAHYLQYKENIIYSIKKTIFIV